MELLPWHHEQWQRLVPRMRDKTLPHALLLTGIKGLGKSAFARRLANSLVCQRRGLDEMACGVCRDCQLFGANTHADVHIVEPLEEGKSILIDQIRDLQQAIFLRTQGHYKVVIITPAERLLRNAANALLKVLEEPAGNAVIMLVTHRIASLPLTIRSRCQRIVFHPPSVDVALSWSKGQSSDEAALRSALALSDGAPLAALELMHSEQAGVRQLVLTDVENLLSGRADPVAMADKWHKRDAKTCLHWLQRITIDLVRLGACPNPPLLYNKDAQKSLQQIANRIDLLRLHSLLAKVNEGLRLSELQINPQLLLEDVLITFNAAQLGH